MNFTLLVSLSLLVLSTSQTQGMLVKKFAGGMQRTLGSYKNYVRLSRRSAVKSQQDMTLEEELLHQQDMQEMNAYDREQIDDEIHDAEVVRQEEFGVGKQVDEREFLYNKIERAYEDYILDL